MLTLTPQKLTANLGYAVPRTIVKAGQENLYHHAMARALQAYQILAEDNPEAASYIVPNGFNRRALIKINLRSAMHLLSLRSAPNAHFSIRRVSQRMAAEMVNAFPLLADMLRLNNQETWQSIEDQYFSQIF